MWWRKAQINSQHCSFLIYSSNKTWRLNLYVQPVKAAQSPGTNKIKCFHQILLRGLDWTFCSCICRGYTRYIHQRGIFSWDSFHEIPKIKYGYTYISRSSWKKKLLRLWFLWLHRKQPTKWIQCRINILALQQKSTNCTGFKISENSSKIKN